MDVGGDAPRRNLQNSIEADIAGRSRMRTLPILCTMALATAAHAAPPSECASRFVGTWNHQGGFSSNMATLTRDGQALCSGNMFCAQGTWTCSGMTVTYTNSAGTFTYTLQPDGRTLQGPGQNVAIKVGGSTNADTVDAILDGRRRTNAGMDDARIPPRSPSSTERDGPRRTAPAIAQEIKDGDTFMAKAQRTLRGGSVEAKRAAANDFRGAAEFYAQGNDPDRQRRAVAAADAADAQADRMEQRARTKRGREPASCAQAKDYMAKLAASGNDVEPLRASLEAQGCAVSR